MHSGSIPKKEYLAKVFILTLSDLKVRSDKVRSVNLKIKLTSCNFSQKTNETHSGYYPESVSFVFWEEFQLDNFVLKSTDL